MDFGDDSGKTYGVKPTGAGPIQCFVDALFKFSFIIT
jgi:hypothetical protein